MGAEWKQGGREIPDRESGLEVPTMEHGASGHQLLIATLLKQVGIGNSIHPSTQSPPEAAGLPPLAKVLRAISSQF